MIEWILIGVLYVAALLFFRLLGGFGSAGSAIRGWGHSRTASRVAHGSSGSSG
jgi:hypothetical protein